MSSSSVLHVFEVTALLIAVHCCHCHGASVPLMNQKHCISSTAKTQRKINIQSMGNLRELTQEDIYARVTPPQQEL